MHAHSLEHSLSWARLSPSLTQKPCIPSNIKTFKGSIFNKMFYWFSPQKLFFPLKNCSSLSYFPISSSSHSQRTRTAEWQLGPTTSFAVNATNISRKGNPTNWGEKGGKRGRQTHWPGQGWWRLQYFLYHFASDDFMTANKDIHFHGSNIRPFPGLVNFVSPVPSHFCLNLPAACRILATWERPYSGALYVKVARGSKST